MIRSTHQCFVPHGPAQPRAFDLKVDGHRIVDVNPRFSADKAGLRAGAGIVELQAQDVRYSEHNNMNGVIVGASAMLQRLGRCETTPGEQTTGAASVAYPQAVTARRKVTVDGTSCAPPSAGRSNASSASFASPGQTTSAKGASPRSFRLPPIIDAAADAPLPEAPPRWP